MTTTRTEEILKECQRQEASCRYTAAGLFMWQKKARRRRNFFIVAPIVLGGMVSSEILTNAHYSTQIFGETPWLTHVTALMALLAGLFPAIYKALDMDARVEMITASANDFTNLRDRFRQMANLGRDMPVDDLYQGLMDMMAKMDAAREKAPPLPEKYFTAGQIKIKAGDYDFAVDN